MNKDRDYSQCPYCEDYNGIQKSSYYAHIKKYHEAESKQKQVDSKKFVCKYCNYKSSTELGLKKHKYSSDRCKMRKNLSIQQPSSNQSLTVTESSLNPTVPAESKIFDLDLGLQSSQNDLEEEKQLPNLNISSNTWNNPPQFYESQDQEVDQADFDENLSQSNHLPVKKIEMIKSSIQPIDQKSSIGLDSVTQKMDNVTHKIDNVIPKIDNVTSNLDTNKPVIVPNTIQNTSNLMRQTNQQMNLATIQQNSNPPYLIMNQIVQQNIGKPQGFTTPLRPIPYKLGQNLGFQLSPRIIQPNSIPLVQNRQVLFNNPALVPKQQSNLLISNQNLQFLPQHQLKIPQTLQNQDNSTKIQPVSEMIKSSLLVSNEFDQVQQTQNAVANTINQNTQQDSKDLAKIPKLPKFSEVIEISKAEFKLDDRQIKQFVNQFSKKSDHLWPETHSIVFKDTNSTKTQHSHLTRSQYSGKMSDELSNSNAQIGMGEITFEGLQKIINYIKTIGDPDIEQVYCDLGSGFGGATFQIAATTRKITLGIEIVPSRFQFSINHISDLKKTNPQNQELLSIIDLCQFSQVDIEKINELKVPDSNKFITHIYCFNKVMNDKTNKAIVKLINSSDKVQCLAWTLDKDKTFKEYKLKNFEFANKFTQIPMRGSGEKSTFYIFKRQLSFKQNQDVLAVKDSEVQQELQNQKNDEVVIQEIQKIQTESNQNLQDQDRQLETTLISKRTNQHIDNQQVIIGSKRIDSQGLNYQTNNSQSFNKGIEYLQSEIEENKKSYSFILQTLQVIDDIKTKLDKKLASIQNQQAKFSKVENIFGMEWRTRFFETETPENQEKLNNLVYELTVLREFKTYLMKNSAKILQDYQNDHNMSIAWMTKQVKQLKDQNKIQDSRNIDFVSQIFFSEGLSNFEFIGSGLTSNVYKCQQISKFEDQIDFNPNKLYALKIPKSNFAFDFREEVKTLQLLKNLKDHQKNFIAHSIKIIKFAQNKLAILFDYYPMTLKDLILKNLNENQIKCIAYCLIKQIYVAHQQKICHKDLKPANILVNDDWIPKISDWGMSHRQNGGTEGYYAPEQFDMDPNLRINYQDTDKWQLGIVIYQLLHKMQFPFDKKDMEEFVKSQKPLKFPDSIIKAKGGLLQIVNYLLKIDPKDRISLESLINHQSFDRVHILLATPLNIKSIK